MDGENEVIWELNFKCHGWEEQGNVRLKIQFQWKPEGESSGECNAKDPTPDLSCMLQQVPQIIEENDVEISCPKGKSSY